MEQAEGKASERREADPEPEGKQTQAEEPGKMEE